MAHWRQLERTVDLLVARVRELSTKQSTSAGSALLVRINELEAALDALQKSNRREFGRLWKLVPDERPARAASPNGHAALDVDDPELAAELALQSAPPAKP
jgi:hypothetical protein